MEIFRFRYNPIIILRYLLRDKCINRKLQIKYKRVFKYLGLTELLDEDFSQDQYNELRPEYFRIILKTGLKYDYISLIKEINLEFETKTTEYWTTILVSLKQLEKFIEKVVMIV